jgi:type IV pilus assembly protein PilY1
MKSVRHDRSMRPQFARRLIAGLTLAGFLATPPGALAAPTDIANAPISSAASTTVPPNVLFILDASGSMGREHMPDDASGWAGRIGGKSHLCNTIYYNPATKYAVPKNADGTDFPQANFFSASSDGFLGGGSSNLSSNFVPNGSTSAEPAYYYSWSGTTLPTASDCDVNDQTGNHTTGNWTKVFIAAADQQNFANWYTYYRTRMLLMKSAAGRAFNGLNDTFRIGFITICPDGGSCDNDTATVTVNSNYYLKIDTFTPTHKSDWYKKLYEQNPSSFTPLRQALARAGRHFAGRTDGINQGMNDDPIQYSCQQNFAILTTDGYWNYGRGKKIGDTTGTANIGEWDNDIGLTPRPMFDGGAVNTVLTQEHYNDIRNPGTNGCSSSQRRADRWERSVTTSQTGGTTTSSWTRINNDFCFAATKVDAAITAGCTSGGTPGGSSPACPLGTSTSGAGSTANTLADVAEYYYRTDLRPAGSKNAQTGVDVGTTNNVPASGTGPEDDKAPHQHMTTFTLGLGLDGNLKYDANYKTQTSGDFADIRGGAKGWPNPNPGQPNDGSISQVEKQARIDDLWHAAVNGRGQYFSAKDPTSLALSLQTALSAIQTRLASAAAAATSTLEPTETDNLVILPTYTTNEWSGELEAHVLDVTPASPTYGQVLPAVTWSAQTKLNARTQPACDTRKIKLFRAGATDNLVDFTWNTTSCSTGTLVADGLNDSEKAFFLSPSPAPGAVTGDTVDEPADLSQWGLMTEDGAGPLADQQTAARGANLVNFVRGQRGKEGFAPNDVDKLYRTRKHVLGDVVNSQPVYVRGAFFSYADTGYAAFKASVDPNPPGFPGRAPMVYAAANDGMLHAFTANNDATGGEEEWAFIPSAVLPRLYKLADNNYANLHEYYVDGKPVAADVFDGANWRTILVGGLNKGGRGYYALDVTDPATPKALWEFKHTPTCASSPVGQLSDCNLGYSFGNPVVTKMKDGTWVALVTSGYNNTNTTAQTGDGQGFLYVLNAVTGAIIQKIRAGDGSAAFGSPTTPSGLSKISAWVDQPDVNNMAVRVYGVDLLGHIWRFDINSSSDATLLTQLKDAGGNPQPITIRPELAEVGSPPEPFVYVATGKYLHQTDVGTTQSQSVYAIRDPLTTGYTNVRNSLKQLTLTTTGNDRFVSCNTSSSTANCSSTDGWYVDLTEPGERVNVEMKLQLGTLVVASNVPTNTACEPGGFSFLNFFDFETGFSPAGTTQRVGYRLSSALTVGISIVRLPDGTVKVLSQKSTAGIPEIGDVPIGSGAPSGKRVMWRELAQ